MQPKSRKRGLLFSLTITTLLLAGCPSPPPTATAPTTPRYPGVTLTVACPPEAAALLEAYAPRWSLRTGARVNPVAWDGVALPPNADILVMSPAAMPGHATAGHLQRVPASLQTSGDGYGWDRLLPVYRDKLLIWNGTPWTLPLLGEAPLLFLNTRLLDDAEMKLGRKFAQPATWEEYLQVAQLFAGKQLLNGPSLPPLPRDDDELDREFFAVAAPFVRRALAEGQPLPSETEMFSFHFDLQTMQPRIDGPGFVHALKLLQQLQECRPPGTAACPAEAFARGEAVLCLAEARAVELFRKGKVAGKFSVNRVPGAGQVFPFGPGQPQAVAAPNFISYLGASGWLAGVTADSGQTEAAWDLLAELTGPQTSRQIVINPRWGGGATRRDAFDDRGGWDSFDLPSKEQTRRLVNVLEEELVTQAVKNTVLRLRIPGQAEYQKALLAEVRQALLQGKDAAKALADAAAAWRRLGETRDVKVQQREYYLSLSLRPPD